MRYVKQTPRGTYGYETVEISKEEALRHISEETLSHLDELIKTTGANAALSQIGDESIYIGVARN